MSRRPYDPWRDVDGVHLPDGSRVEQIGVAKEHGALPSRLYTQGQVLGRGTNRLTVQFDGADRVASVRPHLLRVLDAGDGVR